MAAPVEEVRIPKRGEMGMTPADVKHFESVGYVMGGSRYKKVEPVRVRKENQVRRRSVVSVHAPRPLVAPSLLWDV